MVPPPLGWTAPPWPTSSFPHPLLLPIGKPLFRLPTPASSLCSCFLPPCELDLSYRLQPFCPGTRLGPSCQVWAGSQTHVQPDFSSEQAPGQRPCPGPPPSGSLEPGLKTCKVLVHCLLPSPSCRAWAWVVCGVGTQAGIAEKCGPPGQETLGAWTHLSQ